MEIEFIPLDYDTFDIEGKSYLKIFGKTSEGKKACLIDFCDVFFWIIPTEEYQENNKKMQNLCENLLCLNTEFAGRKVFVKKTEIHNKNFLDKLIVAIKVFISNPKDANLIGKMTEELEGVEMRKETDINYITRYIIEKKLIPLKWHKVSGKVLNNSLEFGNIDSALDVDFVLKVEKIQQISDEERRDKKFFPKVLAFDIETEEFEIGKGRILMISIIGEKLKKVLTWKQAKHNLDYVEHCKDEENMLEKFVEIIKKEKPDILTGYFSDGFDMPYLRARAEKNKMRLNIALDGTQPKFARGKITSAYIAGIVHIDLFRFIEVVYAQYLQSETLGLNDVASELLGESKYNFEKKDGKDLKEHEWEQFFGYNLQDSVLTYKLFEKLWPDLQQFSQITSEPLFDTSRAGFSQHVENYIIHNLEKFNEIAERKPIHEEIEKRKTAGKVEGAFVLQPQAGLYENVVMFDFTSMHTSIIISMNISKSTLLEKPGKDCISIETSLGKFYFSKKPGFFPLMLKEIFETRKKFKEEYKKNPNPITKARSNAFKVLSASIHGYIGFFGARYYSKECSASILAYVRKFNQDTIREIEKKGYKVIYADTDSVVFLTGNKPESEIKELLNEINSSLPGIMELELEGFYKRGIWVTKRTGDFGAKKKYALIDEKGKIKVRGFETVRRDWCNLARKMQNNIIKMILEDGNEKQALEYLKEIIKKVKNREIDKSEILIRTQLKKPIHEYLSVSPHVVAAQKMKEKGLPIDIGMLIEFFIAETRETKKLVREKVKLPEEKGEYNIKYYLEHQILPAVENIFQVFNINVKEILDGKKQMKLGEF